MRLSPCVALITVVCASAGLFAQAEPAAAPAAAVAADATTPRGTLKLLSRAMEAGDRDAIVEFFAVDNDAERQFADAMAQVAASMATFRTAATEKFGPAEVDAVLGNAQEQSAASAQAIDEAAQSEEPDGIVVLQVGQEIPVRLRKTDDGYLVIIADAMEAANAVDMTHEKLLRQGELFEAMSGEIAEGRYKSMQEVESALLSRMLQASSPATQPAAEVPAEVPAELKNAMP